MSYVKKPAMLKLYPGLYHVKLKFKSFNFIEIIELSYFHVILQKCNLQ